MMGTGLQIHIKNSIFRERSITERIQTFHFGMWPTMGFVPTFSKNAITLHKYATYHRVRRYRSSTIARQL